MNTGIKWRESISMSRGDGVENGLVVRDGTPWFVVVKRWREYVALKKMLNARGIKNQ